MSMALAWLLGERVAPRLEAIGLGLLRLLVGLVIVYFHGWHKVVDGLAWADGQAERWPFLDEVVKVGFPLPVASAWFATFAQLGGGLLIAAGCFTRVGALLVVTTLAGAIYTNLVLAKDGQSAVVYLLLVSLIALHGDGKLSLGWGRRRLRPGPGP